MPEEVGPLAPKLPPGDAVLHLVEDARLGRERPPVGRRRRRCSHGSEVTEDGLQISGHSLLTYVISERKMLVYIFFCPGVRLTVQMVAFTPSGPEFESLSSDILSYERS